MSKHLIQGSQLYISIYESLPSSAQAGQVWFDGGTQQLKVYDGNSWRDLYTAQPTLSWEAENAIDHVIGTINNQKQISDMAAKYPLVAEALGQLEVALKLCQNLENDGN